MRTYKFGDPEPPVGTTEYVHWLHAQQAAKIAAERAKECAGGDHPDHGSDIGSDHPGAASRGGGADEHCATPPPLPETKEAAGEAASKEQLQTISIKPNTSYMALHGSKLLAQGYLPIPIRNGSKRPYGEAWQKRRMTPDDIYREGEFGVGILTGQGEYPLAAIDIDVKHPALAAVLTKWCRDNLPATAERIGDAPKIMFVYRAMHAGIKKQSSASFIDPENPTKPNGKPLEQQIEILGEGQQFVAYHIHPETGRPYQWVDLIGGLTAFSAADLPVLPPEKIDELIAVFERSAPQHGLVPEAKAPPKSSTPLDDLDSMVLAAERNQAIANANEETFEDLNSALAFIDLTPRDEWIRSGNNLACFKGTKWELKARALWEEAAAKAATHDPEKDADKWDDLPGDRSDFRAIFARAKKAGWKNPRSGAAPKSTLTASQVIDVLQQKSKEEIIDAWAAQAANLPRDAAEEVIEAVNRLTGVQVRPLRAALKDTREEERREHKEAVTRRRIGKRTEIPYEPENRTAHADEVERLMVKDARPGECVSFGGVLASVADKQVPYTHIIGDETEAGPPVTQIEPLDAVAVLAKIEKVAAFRYFDLIAVPQSIVEIVLKKSAHVAPRVNGLLTHPIVLPDGSILSQDGLDESTGLFLRGISIPQLRPYMQQEAADAVSRIKAELFGEFEFASPLDADIAVAGLLTGVQRRLLDMAPGLALLASMQASGKTTLVRTIHIVLAGRDMPVSTFPENDEAEVQKRLLSMLLRSPALVCFDNITDGTTFRSSAIAAVMTGPVLIQRVLGVSREAECPTNVLLAITGNNLSLGPDELTRWMVCRLAPSSARPHERAFRHPDVLAHVLRMRSDVLRDAIGIVAGFLTSDASSFGSSRFPRWDRMVRQPLLWAGAGDVAEVFRANVEGSEDIGACMGVLKALRVIFGEASFYAADVSAAASTDWEYSADERLPKDRITTLGKAEAHDLKTRLVTSLETLRTKDVSSARSVARALRSIVGRPVEITEGSAKSEARLEALPMLDGVARYRVTIKEWV